MPFESLNVALGNWFDKPLTSLPTVLQQRVEKDFFPLSWESLSVEQRRELANQWDYKHDPAMESDRKYWWDFYQRKQNLKSQIEQWSSIATPTATDLAQQETRLAALKLALAEMERQERQQPSIGELRAGTKKENQDGAKLVYIAYPKAMKLLSERIKATPEELAAWIFYGPKKGGLAAYLNANELNPPPRFLYSPGREGDFDYLSSLMSCWFSVSEINKFQPAERYVSGEFLIERWSKQPDIKARAFILAKIEESRLDDLHPIYGGTEARFGDGYPPLETGLFSLTQIKNIEKSDFGDDETDTPISNKPTGHLNHDPEMQLKANVIAAEIFTATGRVPTKDRVSKKLAEQIEIPVDTVLRRIRAEWK
jgi:hypothetical protein